MSALVSRLPCYLVEWYRPDLTEEQLNDTVATLEECAASMSAEGSPVQLLMTLSVPTDEVISSCTGEPSADIDAAHSSRVATVSLSCSSVRSGRYHSTR